VQEKLKSKIEKTRPKNQLIEQSFKKIGLVNRTGKIFWFSVMVGAV